MPAMFKPCLLLSIFFFSLLPLFYSQNLEAFYPLDPPAVITVGSLPISLPFPTTQVHGRLSPPSFHPKSPGGNAVKVVVGAVVSSLVVAGLFFFFLHRFVIAHLLDHKDLPIGDEENGTSKRWRPMKSILARCVSLFNGGSSSSSAQISRQLPLPPPLETSVKRTPAQPLPPPTPLKASVAPQASKYPLSSSSSNAPKSKSSGSKELGETSSSNAAAEAKLKPADADLSMVWDKTDGGSYRFDNNLMEALFGHVAANRKSPKNSPTSNLSPSSPGPHAPKFILSPRKSQNTAIVLRTILISRKEILDALHEGEDLNSETLEKLARIAPTKEEEDQILEFDGNPTKLALAESFLYHLLKAVRSPFARINAMLFRPYYDFEMLRLKEQLQALESGCNELQTNGVFLKLLEAVLEAGNVMNRATVGGNAQAFNLDTLRKLSDVKSTNGETTLLHFVVEEVVRSEGKRTTTSRSSNDHSSMRSDREDEYMMLGLPVVEGLGVDLSNVERAATIDYNSFANICPVLATRVTEIWQLLAHIYDDQCEGFVRGMEGFLETAEEELKTVKEEQIRVMELVKRTTRYYQAGAFNNGSSAQPLQLFVIINDFLRMVDQACTDIAGNQQKTMADAGSSTPPPRKWRAPIRFPNLPTHFMSDKSSSGSDEGF